jgi:hypothetical protein
MNPVLLLAQNINDVPSTDALYPAAQRVVKEGYLSLYTGGKFQGDQTVSRRELALVLDRLLSSMDQKGLTLSKLDFQELSTLAKNFKSSFSDLDTKANEDKGTLTQVSDEQKALNHDLTKMNDELKEEIKSMQSQQLFMWAGIGAAALIGIIVK